MEVDRQKLTIYLLGRLSEEEQDNLAERYFIDDALFEELQEVEFELIVRYVRDQLSPGDRAGFESYLNNLPNGKDKVAVARVLAEAAEQQNAFAWSTEFQAAAAHRPIAAESGWWQTLVGWLSPPVPKAALATGLALVGAVGIMGFYLRQVNQENQQLRAQMGQQAELGQKTNELQQQLTEQQTLTAKLQEQQNELQQELKREQELRESLSLVRAPNSLNTGPTTSWILASSLLRDPFAPPDPAEVMRLSEKTKTVALTIPVKGNQKYSGYEVELKTADGKQILWKDAWPQTPPPRAGRDIVFYRPASEFTAASYKLTLTLIRNGERMTRDHYFTVIKQ